MKNNLAPLPPKVDLETKAILKKQSSANRYLAELKGILGAIPNQEILTEILIKTLFLQEAKDSSAIENIITTQDELFKDEIFKKKLINSATKEVRNYEVALKAGFRLILQKHILTTNMMVEIQSHLQVEEEPGLRSLPGTVLKNRYNEVIYTPPQDSEVIINLMTNLEKFINEDEFFSADSLVKMALIHYQFESIHPFYDGNGRTGRIVNVLYLTLKDLLPIPILYLSRYIVQNKNQYYELLQKVRTELAWEEWILYILDAIESTSKQTISMIQDIYQAYLDYQAKMEAKYKFYSLDLLNILFKYPYTKIDLVTKGLNVSRITATTYLDTLAEDQLLKKESVGKNNYYINVALLKILSKNDKNQHV